MALGALTVKFEGHAELERVFNALPRRVQVKALRPALRVGAKMLLARAKHEMLASWSESGSPAPHVADTLKIKAMRRDRSKRGRVGLLVITGRRDELEIPARTKAGGERGYYPTSREFGHRTPASEDGTPGRHVPADPAMKRALEAGRAEATEAIARELSRQIHAMADGTMADDDALDRYRSQRGGARYQNQREAVGESDDLDDADLA